MAAKKTTTGTATRSEQTEPMFSKDSCICPFCKQKGLGGCPS